MRSAPIESARPPAARSLVVTALAFILWIAPARAAEVGAAAAASPAADSDAYHRLVDRYFDDYFRRHPSSATNAGLHQYDRLLENLSRAAVDSEVVALREFRERFRSIAPRHLAPDDAVDRELVLHAIDARLLDVEQVRPWERNPDDYSSRATQSVFGLLSRDFAPLETRMRAVIARERQIPRALVEARRNLKNPPRVFTEVALEQLPGSVRFFRNDVPKAFLKIQDAKLKSDFRRSNAATIAALEGYRKFLHDTLLARSKGDFRLGPALYRRKLELEEMVDLPLQRLLEIGMADLRTNQQRYLETAKRLDPTRTAEEILADLDREHPDAGELLPAFRRTLTGLREFVVERKIVTLPSPVPPVLRETPPFARALTFASMDTPGPFEKKARTGFFYVTPPDPSWPKDRIEGFLSGFTYGQIISTAVHEAYPGHYVQFLYESKAPSKVRKLLYTYSNSEGWAHYCEEMMLDEGYGGGDLKLRLGQLKDALLRNARFVVGVRMHTGTMTFDQGVDFFVKEGHQSRATAEIETRRGTSDPTYLAYTLGKLQILNLREDYRRQRGAAFRIGEFHDRFLLQGALPIRLIRRAMLGNESPTL